MTKREATNYYRRLSRCIDSKKPCIELKRIGTNIETIQFDEPYRISVDPRSRSPLMRNIIHALIHAIDYDMPENRVLKLESELFETLSDRQLNGLFKRAMAG
jgi:hypothetical protein